LAAINISIEFSVNELKVLRRIIQNHNPSLEDEMIALMLYNRLFHLIKKACDE